MSAEYSKLQELARTDPDAFRKLLTKLDKKVVRPHTGQRAVVDSVARFRVMNCGRRWGKTIIAAKIFVSKSRKDKQMLWWIAPTYKVVKRGYKEVVRQLPDGVLEHDPPPETHFDAGRAVVLRFKNGTRMEFYSAERPGGMLGEGVDFAVLDEAATMPGNIWNQIVRPTLADRRGGALMISTPRGRNWFYKVWLRGQDQSDPNWESWTFESWTNPTLPLGEIEDMKAEMPRLLFEQEVEAKFLAAGSSVFLIPDRSVQLSEIQANYMVEETPPAGHVVLGVDLAKSSDWTVIYGARSKDRRNCYFERMQAITWPEQKRRIKRAVHHILKSGATGVTLVMDSTGVGDPIVDDMEAAGYDVVPINFTTHKNNMVKLLAKDLEESRAFVLEDGHKVEFENYAMNMTPSGKITYSAPEGEHDDVVSAKMLQHWGVVNEGVPGAMVLSIDDPPEREKDEFEEPNEFEYLVDPDEITEEEALDAIGIPKAPDRPPTAGELLNNPELWF